MLTARARGEHLRAAEGWRAWLHLTVVEVGTEFIATVHCNIAKLIPSDFSYVSSFSMCFAPRIKPRVSELDTRALLNPYVPQGGQQDWIGCFSYPDPVWDSFSSASWLQPRRIQHLKDIFTSTV